MSWWKGTLVGLAAGGLVGGILWYFARKSLDDAFQQGALQLASQLTGGSGQLQQQLQQGQQQLQAQIARDVPGQVQQTIQSTLSSYGITPQMGQRFATLVNYAQSHGMIS
jgi:predicted PurR-regulated permease PerM